MITQLTPTTRRRKPIIVAILVLLAIILGLILFMIFGPKKTADTEYPLYFNFAGNYAFTVPKDFTVDEQSVPGIQLVYSGTLTVRTLADIYDAGGLSVRAFAEKGDTKFKEFIDKTYIPDLKKELETDDVQVKFSRQNGSDVARVTAKKDGSVFRFFYLKDGKHPAALTAKDENDALKKVAQTLVDGEDSVVKNDIEPVKTAIQTVGEQSRDQKASEIFDAASPELQANASKDQLTEGLKQAADYLGGNVTVSGVSLDSIERFSAAMRFVKLDDPEQKSPAFGSVVMKKIDGQWKLEALGLPSPTQQ